MKKILRGHQREETARFIAFRSHWGFHAEFCTPGEGHEKGGVEGEGGQYRRNHLVPVPQVRNLKELNRLLESESGQEQARLIAGLLPVAISSYRLLGLPLRSSVPISISTA